ncbi:MAG TPA: hypothetical protein VF310_03320 [Vicinamibacteria bacterium]
MANFWKRLLRLGGAAAQGESRAGGFVDSLLQSFENRRAGLPDEAARPGSAAALRFFANVYETEAPRVSQALQLPEGSLPEPARAALGEQADTLIREVVIPAYARLAAPFTGRERNGFYLVREPWHNLERLAWAVGGMLLGAFVVWAPFIPVWEKEWVLPFTLAGLFFPNLRRLLALKRYQNELNRLVTRAGDEIWRLELACLTGGALEPASAEGEALKQRLAAAAPPADEQTRPKRKQLH